MNLSLYLAAALLAPLLMFLERVLGDRIGRRGPTLGHAINSLSHYLAELALTVTLNLNVFAAFAWLTPRVALFHVGASPLAAVGAFVAIDFVYWVGHRVCHRIGVLWGLHAVHHQSREMNLASGLRGPWFSALQIAPFLLPLAMLGLPLELVFGAYAVQTVYKLVIHTNLVDSFGPLDALFVSPAAHRLHHLRDAEHHGVNFGGVLSIWDRVFGTYRAPSSDVRSLSLGLPGAEPALDPLANNLSGFGIELRPRSVGSSRPVVIVPLFAVTFALSLAFTATAESLPMPLRFVGCGAVIALVTLLGRNLPQDLRVREEAS